MRGHLSEFGQIVPQGATNASKLIAIVEDPESDLPADAIPTLRVLIAALTQLESEIGKLDPEIARRAKENEVAQRLMTVPGIGPLIATAIAVLAPPPETFRKARDFAAWYVEVPKWDVSLRKGHHEALITFETFERIQQRLQEGAKAPAR